MRGNTIRYVLLMAWLPAAWAVAAGGYQCTFTSQGWTPKDWIQVKDQGTEHFGGFVQRDGCIENKVPEGLTPKKLQSCHETWASMVYAKKVSQGLTVKTALEFDFRMCPTVVLVPELAKGAKGEPEYRSVYHVCVYDQGVNVWRQTPKDGKPDYTKAAFAKFPLKPKTRYTLEVGFKVGRRGRVVTISIDGHTFGFHAEGLPDELYVGLAAMEGLNRFYDFSISQ